MEDAQKLLAKAEHYREMARQIGDQRAREVLLDLAAEYARMAQSKRDRGDDQNG